MDAKTIEALQSSIEHWDRMRRLGPVQTKDEPVADDCALCRRFHGPLDCERDDGETCPVFQRTGRRGCQSTPYVEASDAWEQFVIDDSVAHERAWQTAADAEIAFLQSLLPTPTPPTNEQSKP